jgi:hypothetical protein
MGDSDDSYDFSAIDPFVAKLREGCDLVMGNRFQGGIRPGAMPLKHRWLGNPVLTFIGRLLFRSPVGDFHCGLRGFSKDAFAKMGLQTSGMEFASEMVIKSTLLGFRIAEVPTVLHPDGRSRPPHLRSWRDGWRHLRFMLLFSPLWLFLIPGAALFLLGAAAVLALLNGPRRIGAVELDVHTMLVSAIGCLLGSQTIVFAVFTKTFAVVEGFHPPYPPLEKLQRSVTLEAGLLLGIALFIGGLGVLSSSVLDWGSTSFGHLDPVRTMRRVIPAVLLLGLGAQTVFASFFLGVLGLRRTTRR